VCHELIDIPDAFSATRHKSENRNRHGFFNLLTFDTKPSLTKRLPLTTRFNGF
jgi:hypothetical protein